MVEHSLSLVTGDGSLIRSNLERVERKRTERFQVRYQVSPRQSNCVASSSVWNTILLPPIPKVVDWVENGIRNVVRLGENYRDCAHR